MANNLILSYLPRGSVVHKLTGTTKLIVFLLFSVATMVTYDTRVLVVFLVMSLAIFKISRVRYRDVKFILWMAFVFLVLNNLFVYLFKPEYGVEIYQSRTLLVQLIGPYTFTAQQLFYHLNMTLKVVVVIPLALVFILCTDPSELAASLASIGVSYRIGYAVALALRYIPDVQRDYHNINQAQQARGVDISGKDKLMDRLKGSANILLPLILGSLNRIEVISNAMELRGFGKNKRRTWYAKRPFATRDWVVLVLGTMISVGSLIFTFWDGSRYYNPFI